MRTLIDGRVTDFQDDGFVVSLENSLTITTSKRRKQISDSVSHVSQVIRENYAHNIHKNGEVASCNYALATTQRTVSASSGLVPSWRRLRV